MSKRTKKKSGNKNDQLTNKINLNYRNYKPCSCNPSSDGTTYKVMEGEAIPLTNQIIAWHRLNVNEV